VVGGAGAPNKPPDAGAGEAPNAAGAGVDDDAPNNPPDAGAGDEKLKAEAGAVVDGAEKLKAVVVDGAGAPNMARSLIVSFISVRYQKTMRPSSGLIYCELARVVGQERLDLCEIPWWPRDRCRCRRLSKGAEPQ
jgi:hypothetical protein